MTTHRIVLADDHRIVRDGLRALLQAQPDFEVVGEAEDGLEAIEVVRSTAPAVVVADVSMPGLNGIDMVRRLRDAAPGVPVLCLSVHDEERLVLAMVEAGAAGYVLKGASFLELAQAIRQVIAGRTYVSPSLVGVFVAQVRARAQPAAGAAAVGSSLTPRERELVQLFSEGYSTHEIAERLHVSSKTVATHRENIQHKLNIGGIAEMTRYALREGLSSLDTPCRPAVR
jgi:DNA-binding NarL/FixJ family response regulator